VSGLNLSSLVLVWLALSMSLGACSTKSSTSEVSLDAVSTEVSGSGPVDPWATGPHPPGHTTVHYEDEERGRTLSVEVWYPSDSGSVVPAPLHTFEAEPEGQDAVEALLSAAPMGCPTAVTGATRDAPVAGGLGQVPAVLFSHCINCGRYSSFSLAERLASHGFVVLAVDHAGELPFVPGEAGETLDEPQLAVRVEDLREVLDAAIAGALFEGVAALAGLAVDAARVGAYGHSFGAVTTGKLSQDDHRIRAAAGLMAPMASIFFPEVVMSEISVPVLLMLAEEDNSILEIGNELLRMNYEEANPPVWRVDVADAGHWSPSDLCGLTEAFAAGCGPGKRHSAGREGEDFEYIAPSIGIDIARRYLTAFFLAHLTENAEANALLESPPEEPGLTVFSRLE
jgi:predicted dienelactone hydrolase